MTKDSSPKLKKPETILDIRGEYHSLVESLSVGVYRNTPGVKGLFLEANSAMLNIFDAKSKAELLKHNVSDLYQNPEKRKEFVEEIIKKHEVKNKEMNLISLRGRKFIGSVSAVMKRDRNGQIYFDGIVEDITKRKKMEEELINDKNTLEMRVKERTQKLQSLNKKQSNEIAIRSKIQNVLVANNEELERTKKAMLNVMEDLDEAKSAIDRQRSRDESILASVGDGLIAINSDGKIIVMNTAAEKMLDWKIEEALGKSYNDIISLEDEDGTSIPFNKRPLTRVLALSTTTIITITNLFLVSKNKIKFPVAITVSPIILDNKIIGGVEVFRDISREKEIDKAKTEFVSLASHQLTTPLGITKWYLEALDEEGYIKNAPATVRSYFDEIHKSNERVLSLVRDLLSVSRIEQGRVKDNPVLTDVKKIILEIMKQMKILALKKDINLTLDMEDKIIPQINIDDQRLHEVIENLINNAIVYTTDKGKVCVIVKKDKSSLVISVKDTGIGISPNDQKMLFTKFFRTEKAIKVHPEGSGLGLYVVKSYVEGWGGKIMFESTEGIGSTFTITLPVKDIKEISGRG